MVILRWDIEFDLTDFGRITRRTWNTIGVAAKCRVKAGSFRSRRDREKEITAGLNGVGCKTILLLFPHPLVAC
jgi:hypothetical protein